MSRAFDTAFPTYGLPMGGYNLSSGFIKPLKIDDTGALVVAASVSASIAAFLPTGHTTLAVTVATGNVAFGSADNSLVLRNIGSQACYFKLGAAGVTAATTDFYLAAGDWCCLDRTGQVRIAAITASGTTTLEIWTGTGLASLSQAGGSGGGGGNVNITQVGGAAIALGQTTMANSFPVVLSSNQSSIPVTGTFWQATQPVSLATLPALVAGAAIIGKVGIDQTTNGVTNAVDILNMPVTLDTNTGNASASTIRVVLATNQPAVAVSGTFWQATQPISGTVSISNWPATVDTNSGNKSASTPRVILATDSLAIALWGHGVTGVAVPANATLAGLRATTANPTAVADGQMVAPMADKLGRQAVVVNGVRDLIVPATTTLTSTVAETDLLAAGGANIFKDLLSLVISNTSATPATVSLRDAAAGTVRRTITIPAGDVRGFVLQTPLPQTTANNKWTVQSSASVASLVIDAQFVTNT